jgi:hypothetical protein
MTIVRRPGLRGFVLVATAATVSVLGCGKSDPDALPTVPAAGTVTYKGKPVESGSIQFVPTKGRPASGTIKDGNFILSTYKEEDGAIPGTHLVGVTSTKDIPSKNPGADPKVVFLVPANFSDYSSSGLSVEVPAEGSVSLKIEIP